MGVCKRVFLFDEFDWQYVNYSYIDVVEQVKTVIPYAKLEVHIPCLMIFNIDKAHPQDLLGKITCDSIMFTDDDINRLPSIVR